MNTHEHHAISRASERFGFSRHRIPEIKEEIEAGVSWHLHTQGDGREIHCVFVANKEVLVVWNPSDKELVTVLPDHARKNYTKELKAYRES